MSQESWLLLMATPANASPLSPQDAGGSITAQNVDLSNCDREQIQFAGAIQPHGVLLTLREADGVILQASANAGSLLGLEVSQLLGKTISSFLSPEAAQQTTEGFQREKLDAVPPHLGTVATTPLGRVFEIFAHRVGELIVLELEQTVTDDSNEHSRGAMELRRILDDLQRTETVTEFFTTAVSRIRQYSGYDRVLAYKFLEDGSGEVIAESVSEGLGSYLGLRYPASDIPQPSRRLFSMSWVRHLPDVDYTPVPLEPAEDPTTGAPLDLSRSLLRSVSVMYSGYLRNMGVGSTMVMTLRKNGRLWGLVSCLHHHGPRQVPIIARMSCEFLAHTMSLLMAGKEDAEYSGYFDELRQRTSKMVEFMTVDEPFYHGLIKHCPRLLCCFQSSGAAVVVEHEMTLMGETPTQTQLLDLTRWLNTQSLENGLFATDRLAELYPAAEAYREQASGLLALRVASEKLNWLLWFRPEVTAEVKWAGDPNKPVEVDDSTGERRLMPRHSFALWKEEVRGHSRPWLEQELNIASDLRRAVLDIVLRKVQQLALMNNELLRSNSELDSFAYIASHDLKEPLRGIHNYTQLLRRNLKDKLDEEELKRFESIVRLTQRMDELIDSLLHYSRAGRMELDVEPIDLTELLHSIQEMMQERLRSANGKILVRGPLPAIVGDRVRVTEILQNLISNGVKYNSAAQKIVEIGHLEDRPGVFYVRDNGIGIEPQYHESIFGIFKRLHKAGEYGGGSGAGLTITKKLIERHGGRIWLESSLTQGSTFFLRFGPETPAVP